MKHGDGSIVLCGGFSASGTGSLVKVKGIVNECGDFERKPQAVSSNTGSESWLHLPPRTILNMHLSTWRTKGNDLNPIEFMWGDLYKMSMPEDHQIWRNSRSAKEDSAEMFNRLNENHNNPLPAVIQQKGNTSDYENWSRGLISLTLVVFVFQKNTFISMCKVKWWKHPKLNKDV